MRKIFVVSTLLVTVLSSPCIFAGSPIFARDLTIGAKGKDVSELQQFLIKEHFLNVSKPTGYFGNLTKIAVSDWQTSVGIYPHAGYFGKISIAKIGINIGTTLAVVSTPSIDAISTTAASSAPALIMQSSVASSTHDGSPLRLTIPKLGINAGFQYNGLKTDGTMEIPNNIVDVGWFTGSVRPGQKGVAIITGHVAQIRGGVVTKPGIFSRLNELAPGDKIYIQNDKGESTTFLVRKMSSYDPSADATDVFSSKDGGAHLNIITCEGTWSPAQLSYSQRLVVFTDLSQ